MWCSFCPKGTVSCVAGDAAASLCHVAWRAQAESDRAAPTLAITVTGTVSRCYSRSRAMRSVQVVRLEGPAGVEVVEAPEPTVGAGQALVEVHALGASWPDLLLTRGEYQLRPDPPFQ